MILKYDKLLSSFAVNCNLRHYTKGEFRALVSTSSAVTSASGGGWDYNQFCNLVAEARADAQQSNDDGIAEEDGSDSEGNAEADATSGGGAEDGRSDAERFAIAREIAESIKGSFAEIRSAFREYDVNGDGRVPHCIPHRWSFPSQLLDLRA